MVMLPGCRLAEASGACRLRSSTGFVNFKNKTVDYHLQVTSGQAGHVTQKLEDGSVQVSERKLFVKVTFCKG